MPPNLVGTAFGLAFGCAGVLGMAAQALGPHLAAAVYGPDASESARALLLPIWLLGACTLACGLGLSLLLVRGGRLEAPPADDDPLQLAAEASSSSRGAAECGERAAGNARAIGEPVAASGFVDHEHATGDEHEATLPASTRSSTLAQALVDSVSDSVNGKRGSGAG